MENGKRKADEEIGSFERGGRMNKNKNNNGREGEEGRYK